MCIVLERLLMPASGAGSMALNPGMHCVPMCPAPLVRLARRIQAVEKDPSMLKGAWVLILECDYVWMKPMQAPDAASSAPAMQFHFHYIQVGAQTATIVWCVHRR